MSEQTSEALRTWFKRVEPYYPDLFNMAHAICGNYEQAEYALRGAILEVWAQSSEGGMGFRERLRSAVREESLQLLEEGEAASSEFTWPGIAASDSPLMQLAARERPETQRLLVLKYGVGLPSRRIAQLTGMTPGQLRTALNRFEARCRRTLSGTERARLSATLAREMRRQLGSRAGIPRPSTVYRAFEAEASGLRGHEHRVSRLVYRLVVLALTLVCAALFWLFAVLVQSPEIQADPVPAAMVSAPAGGDDMPSVETTYETEPPA